LNEEEIELKYTQDHSNMKEFTPDTITSIEKEARFEMRNLIHRAYDQKLINAAQGSFSRSLAPGEFLITPYGMDRKYLDEQDIVLIKDGKREANKVPSRSVLMHQEIYKQHPEIEAIIIAHPPSLMAFAVTEEVLDSRSIPESYILMRDIPKLEYSQYYKNPDAVVEAFKANTPIVMVKNDSVIVTGSSLLNAFDRLEVAEYSARALVYAKNLGQMVAINEKQLKDIKEAFKLSD
jgi:L-fuculose-phosphate aldolase